MTGSRFNGRAPRSSRSTAASKRRFKRAVAATGGTYIPNPFSVRLLGGNILTVHPLGGCGMGRDRNSGVVNHKLQVFDGARPAPTRCTTVFTCATAR